MARTKTTAAAVRTKRTLSDRLAALRSEVFGDRGGPELARQLGLPIRTWYNYEAGVTVPGEVVLKIIELTSVEPMWLLYGSGPKYRTGGHAGLAASPRSVKNLLRDALHQLESGGLLRAGERGTNGSEEWVQVEGDAMAPVIKDGASVALSIGEEKPEELNGKIVVAYLNGKPLVRWYRNHGRFARLCAQPPAHGVPETIIDLADKSADIRIRRVVRVLTPH